MSCIVSWEGILLKKRFFPWYKLYFNAQYNYHEGFTGKLGQHVSAAAGFLKNFRQKAIFLVVKL